jgi:enediyne biosynthesis protein E4
VDQTLTLSQADAQPATASRGLFSPAVRPLFADVTAQSGIDFRHRETESFDFNREPLLPRELSSEGPALAVGDVNGDGLDDIYVGGAKWQPGALFLQRRDGTFHSSAQPAIAADSLFEDVDAEFFDANGDGKPDLYVVSGGHEFSGADSALQDRLYINDGHGNFRRDVGALPRMAESGSCVAVGDFNGDGHPDLFVGRRAVVGAYGVSPHSYLLVNDGAGHFRDATAELAPALTVAGMVMAAAWVDYDHDGRLDLVVTGEWMPVRAFHQESGHFMDRTKEAGLAGSNGWWNSITVADLNGDGRPDLVLGNLGLNSSLTASAKAPARLYVGDFAHNHTSQPILATYIEGVSYPVFGRDELLPAVSGLGTRYPTYADFAGRSVEEVLPAAERRTATVLEAYDFATSMALDNGRGGFTLSSLPMEAQLSPVRAALVSDFDGDGHLDLLLAGNEFGVPPVFGRYDASYGLMLRGAGDGRFAPVDPAANGLVFEGQVRHIKAAHLATGGVLIVVARNNDKLQVLRILPPSSAQSRP